MAKIFNRVRMTVSGTPAGGNITLGAAQAGYQSYAAAGAANNDIVNYLAEDSGGAWELATATYVSATPALNSRTLIASSTGSLLSLTSAAIISCDVFAADLFIRANNFSDVLNAATAFGNIKQAASQSTSGVQKLWTLTIITATNASWAVPAGTTQMMIELFGGGGSGAGSVISSGQRRGGGGAGARTFKLYSGTMDTTLNITIGAGGAAVAAVAGGAAGNAGGQTSVVGTNLGTLTAPGAVAVANDGSGGNGGPAGTGGDINQAGGAGSVQPPVAAAGVGEGGTCPLGGMGGRNNIGAAGEIPGGGGSCSNHTATSDLSGAGARGEVRIWTR